MIPAGIAIVALTVRSSGIDEHVSALFFDAATRAFPARGSTVLELAGHQLAKSVVVMVWMVLLAASVASSILGELERSRAILWTTLVAMALGPSIVVLLKDINSLHCPWDLKRFGGYADFSNIWFVSPEHAGGCFPSGHAAGGFSLVALMFAGIAEGHMRLRRIGLVAVICAGVAFSAVRIAQGAHFLSHNLWAAAIDWCSAALAFAPLLMHRDRERGSARPALPR